MSYAEAVFTEAIGCAKCKHEGIPTFKDIEKLIRGDLAEQIEAEMRDTREFDTLNNARNTGLRRAAYIVRGGKKNGK